MAVGPLCGHCNLMLLLSQADRLGEVARSVGNRALICLVIIFIPYVFQHVCPSGSIELQQLKSIRQCVQGCPCRKTVIICLVTAGLLFSGVISSVVPSLVFTRKGKSPSNKELFKLITIER